MYYIKMTFEKFAGWVGTTKAKVQEAATSGQLNTRLINGKKYVVRDEKAENWANTIQGRKKKAEPANLPYQKQLHNALDRIDELEKSRAAYKARWQNELEQTKELKCRISELERKLCKK